MARLGVEVHEEISPDANQKTCLHRFRIVETQRPDAANTVRDDELSLLKTNFESSRRRIERSLAILSTDSSGCLHCPCISHQPGRPSVSGHRIIDSIADAIRPLSWNNSVDLKGPEWKESLGKTQARDSNVVCARKPCDQQVNSKY